MTTTAPARLVTEGPNGQPIWNVGHAVVALVEAADADQALSIVRNALEKAGFSPYDESSDNVAFESEPVPADAVFDPARINTPNAPRPRSWVEACLLD